MSLDLTTVSLLDFCNPAVKNDQFFAALCTALDPFLQAWVATISNNQIFCNINNQPSNILDYIALYHFNVDNYSTTLPIATKINLITNVIVDKINKGTPQRIVDILNRNFGIYAELIEWWQDLPPTDPWHNQPTATIYSQGAANTFRVNIAGTVLPATLTTAINAILKGKNVRSYFIGFSSLNSSQGTDYIWAAHGEYTFQVNSNLNLKFTVPSGF